ncbi:hypothetical protein [uncultured Alistipes sp.]|uniref:hypothetical protein n=1 Tax=uncultured Alistipes sp. TaxID=538949 RepID=UPI002608CF6C|nr:hypothetical protein [uncultured Alistipes sp.]
MQTFGARKLPPGFVCDFIGEYDAFGATGISSRKRSFMNKCNGFRPGHNYGHGRALTFRISLDRYEDFQPRILTILRHQDDECERLAGTLYTERLT